MARGIFLVIDGTDGSGKKTQTALLVKRLKQAGKKVATIDFPQYQNFFGALVGRYLSGEFGPAGAVSPYLASVLYAADRFEAKEKIERWLKKGYIVIADRYVSSNQIHQGGKIQNGRARKQFLNWLEELEFGIFRLPRPQVIFYLDVPLKDTLTLLKNKAARQRKTYLHGKKDIHENDWRHLEAAKLSAMKLVKKNNQWRRIVCVKQKQLMAIEEIHALLWQELKNLKLV